MKRVTVLNPLFNRVDLVISHIGLDSEGYFGDPIPRLRRCPVCDRYHSDKPSTVPCYKKYFMRRIRQDPRFRDEILSLQGKVLGCLCKPRPCHGDIIASWLNHRSETEALTDIFRPEAN